MFVREVRSTFQTKPEVQSIQENYANYNLSKIRDQNHKKIE